MNQPHKFPRQQFRKAMLVTSKVKKQMQPFIAQFNKGNIVWMFGAISQLQRIFTSKAEDLQIKFSSIFALKVLFDCGSVQIINLIEAFLLQYIQKAASYKIDQNDEQKGLTYFRDQGYTNQNSSDIEKFGYNYVRLAIQFATVASRIKPRKLYENQEMNSQSQYALVYKKLISQGLKPYDTLAYFKPKQFEETKTKFRQNLAKFKQSSQKYSMYFSKCVEKYLNTGSFGQQISNCKKLFATGDLLVTTDVIGICSQALGQPNFLRRKNAILFLNDFISWGDAEAFVVINQDNFIQDIAKHILNLNQSDLSLSRGKKIYPQIKGQQKQKSQFYIQFLKCIQNWGTYFKKNLLDLKQQSKINKIYQTLKEKKKLQFPQNKNLNNFIKVCTQAFNRNKERTNRILQQCNVDQLPQQSQLSDKLLASQSKFSQKQIKKVPLLKSQVKKQVRQTPADTPYEDMGITYDGFTKAIKNTKKQLQNIIKSQKDVDKRMDYLISFKQNFQSNIQNLEEGSQSKIEEVMDAGFQLVDKITVIQNEFKKYKEKKIGWDQFCFAITGKGSRQHSNSNIKQQSKVKIEPKKQQKIQSKFSINDSRNQDRSSKKKIQSQIKIQNKKQNNLNSQRSDIKNAISSQKASNIGSLPQKSNQGKSSSADAQQFHGDLKSKVLENIQKKEMKTIEVQKNKMPQIREKSFQGSKKQVSSNKKIESKVQMNQQPQFILKKQESNSKPQQKQLFAAVSLDSNKVSSKYQSRQDIQQPRSRSSKIKQEIHSENVDIIPGVLDRQSKQNFSFSPSQNQKQQYRHQDIDEIGKQFNQEDQMESPINKKFQNVNIHIPNETHLMNEGDIWDGQMDEFDQIQQPDLNPLNNSYHDVRQLQTKIKNDPTPSFKACFQTNKYLISSNQQTKKLQKIFWLQKDSSNLFKPSKSIASANGNKSSRVSIPQLLQQRNIKYHDQLNKIQQQKSKHINVLQNKIKILQQQGNFLKQKMSVQQRQIKAIRDLTDDDAISRTHVNKNNYLQDQNYLFKSKMKLTYQNNPVKFTPSKSQYSVSVNNTGQDFKNNYKRTQYDLNNSRQVNFFNPIGKLISMSTYNKYFSEYEKKQRSKRSLLKHKQLAVRQQGIIEIGWMTNRINNSLHIVYYITPEGGDIHNMRVKVQNNQDNKLDIICTPSSISIIQNKKQQKINLEIDVNQVPFKLPLLSLNYIQNGTQNSKLLPIPCIFSKFVETKSISKIQVQRVFQNSRDQILRGQQVPYSKRILKQLNQISQYLPNVNAFNNGYPNQAHQIIYGGLAKFMREQFIFKVCIKPNQFLYIQALSITKQDPRVVSYFICVVTHLLMKQITWKQ